MVFCVFCCILSRVLQHLALRFGAKRNVFCCILRCVLLQNAFQYLSFNHFFLVVAVAKFREFFSKEKCKTIVNSKNWRRKAFLNCSNFARLTHFI